MGWGYCYSEAEWVLKQTHASVTNKVGPLFINILLIWAFRRTLSKGPYSQFALVDIYKKKNGQSREAVNIEYTRRKKNKNKNTTQYVLDATMRKQTQPTHPPTDEPHITATTIGKQTQPSHPPTDEPHITAC